MDRVVRITCVLALLWLLLKASGVLAAPFLVCDTDTNCEYYRVQADGVEVVDNTPAPLHYDLQGMTPGQISFTAQCCNVWGCSEVSDPFVSPEAPGTPAGLSIIP